jgi:heat shock protein HtpX
LIQGTSLLGQILLIVNLPLILTGHEIVSLSGLMVLIMAPYAGLLLQLALSRSREYLADAEAAALLGSPRPLADALSRIERYNEGLRHHLWRWPGLKPNGHPLLRTHPPTSERIRRLLEIQGARRSPPLAPAECRRARARGLGRYPCYGASSLGRAFRAGCERESTARFCPTALS